MLRVVLVDEVLHDAAAFEDADRLAVGVHVGQGWDAAVGVDGGEPGRFLLVGRGVYFADRVGEVELCESDADFDAVGSLPGVEGEVWGWSVCLIGHFVVDMMSCCVGRSGVAVSRIRCRGGSRVVVLAGDLWVSTMVVMPIDQCPKDSDLLCCASAAL